MQSQDGIVLNYYGPSTFTVFLPSGQRLVVQQETEYPRQGRIDIRLRPERTTAFCLRLRIPAWSRQTRVTVNGALVAGGEPGQYLAVSRGWQPGDRVSLELDMALRQWRGEREAAGRASLFRGPLLLAYDRRFNEMDPDDLQAPDLAVEPEIVAWTRWWPAPWVLLRFQDIAGRNLYLCDFATAGAAGTPYRTWLPQVEDNDSQRCGQAGLPVQGTKGNPLRL
jgi:hypothetical protein